MDALDYVGVRFHYGGEFSWRGQFVYYLGGESEISYIERDKVSLPELMGHLRDHCTLEDGALLHWLPSGRQLWDGLRVLADDQACIEMANRAEEMEVADIYVEGRIVQEELDEDSEESNFENEMEENQEEIDDSQFEGDDEDISQFLTDQQEERIQPVTESREKIQKQIQRVKEWYSPSKMQLANQGETSKNQLNEENEQESSDSDFLPGDDSSSEEDEEVVQIQKKFKEFKRNMSSGQVASLDDVILDRPIPQTQGYVVDDEGNETPYENSSAEDESDEELSEGHLDCKKSLYPRFSNEEGSPVFQIGMKFTGKKQFKKAVTKHGLLERRFIKFRRNEAKRMLALYQWPTCSWRCLLSTNSRTNSWQIASLSDVHTCPPRRDNKLVTSNRIAEKYEKFIMANPTWSLERMRTTIQEEMFADVSISKLKRAKSIVMQKALDATKGQYQLLYRYQLELLRSNPGRTVIVKKELNLDPPVFQRIYICLDACKRGFKEGCRKVIGLDGCFFKGATNGELLCAIGRDANGQMYPIAWEVVEKENNESWEWFCDVLFRDVGVGDGQGWVIISDQQKGILNVVQKWAPQGEHRNCARHIYANWRKKFKKKEWQKKFWHCAKAPCPALFNLAKARLAKYTPTGAEALMNTDPCHWSRAWFKIGSNCDSVDNNMCETFNKWIVEARFFPIITMLETIRRKVMVRIQQNRSKCNNWTGIICPNILKKLNASITLSGVCHAICNGADQFEVKHWNNTFTVDIQKNECTCRYWQLSGLPCCHAISCIFFRTNMLDDYIASCYHISEFKKTYSYCLTPVEGQQNWPESDQPALKAPAYVRMPGRPKKERKREMHEQPKAKRISKVGTVIRCRKCKGIGHNRSTCDKRNGVPSTSGAQAHSAAPTPPSRASSYAPTNDMSNQGASSLQSTSLTNSNASKKRGLVKCNARASVTTTGQAALNLQASVPLSQASSSVSLNFTSGKASVQVSAQEPARKKQCLRKKAQPSGVLMLKDQADH